MRVCMGLQAAAMDENSSGNANLLDAARYGEIEEVQAALDEGCSVDGKGRADVTGDVITGCYWFGYLRNSAIGVALNLVYMAGLPED